MLLVGESALNYFQVRPEDKGIYVCELDDYSSVSAGRNSIYGRTGGGGGLYREIRFFPRYPCDY